MFCNKKKNNKNARIIVIVVEKFLSDLTRNLVENKTFEAQFPIVKSAF